MTRFGRKRNRMPQDTGTAKTFVEATGGGWGDVPDVVAADGGSQKDFVRQTLEGAHRYAVENNIAVGQRFEYTISDIPKGITGPHEIVFGLMMEAGRYDLMPGAMMDEVIEFTRLR